MARRRTQINMTPQELLTHARLQSKACRPQRPQPAPNRLVRKYKHLAANDLRWIVRLRWGKEDPGFDDPTFLTAGEIAAKLHLAKSTVGFIVSTFLWRGYRGYERTYQRWRMLSPDLQERLVSAELLQEWAPLSLQQRTQVLLRSHDVRITRQTLSKFYRSHNVKLRAADQCYKAGLAAKYTQQRRDFAVVLGSAVARDADIVYVDETTFTSWMNQGKSWSRAHRPNVHPINNARYSITCFGAIGHCLVKPVYTYGRSTNKDEFQDFLQAVKRNLADPRSKPLLLYDGASAHTAKTSTAMIRDLFTPLKNVPHSCGFNGKSIISPVLTIFFVTAIEHLWSAAKSHHKKLLLLNAHRPLDRADHVEIVTQSLALVPPESITGLVNSNRRYIRSKLAEITGSC